MQIPDPKHFKEQHFIRNFYLASNGSDTLNIANLKSYNVALKNQLAALAQQNYVKKNNSIYTMGKEGQLIFEIALIRQKKEELKSLPIKIKSLIQTSQMKLSQAHYQYNKDKLNRLINELEIKLNNLASIENRLDITLEDIEVELVLLKGYKLITSDISLTISK